MNGNSQQVTPQAVIFRPSGHSPLLAAAGVVREVILPLSLAGVVFGQIIFSALQFYLHVQHPSWALWAAVLGCVSVVVVAHGRSLVFGVADAFFVAFLAILLTSFLLYGQAPRAEFYKYVIFFMTLPYVAARLLNAAGIRNFVNFAFAICAFSLLIIVIELLRLPPELLAADRIRLFVDAADLATLGGDPTTINVGIAAGGLVFLAIALIFRPDRPITSWWKIAAMLMLGGGAIVVVLVAGSRSALLALFVSGILAMALTGLTRWRQKLLVFAVLAFFTALPFADTGLISNSRLALILGKNAAGEEVAQLMTAADSCDRYGDSVSTRIGYLLSAAEMFGSSPLAGVGAGNYGLHYCGTHKQVFVSPHNIVMQAFAETGLFGGLAFCAAGLAALLGACRRFGPAPFDAMPTVTFFVVVATLTGNLFTSYDYFACLGLLAAASALRAPRKQGAATTPAR